MHMEEEHTHMMLAIRQHAQLIAYALSWHAGLQAWLVPHEASDTGSVGCSAGAVPAVHSGFSASWRSGLQQAVCTALQKAVQHSSRPASKMRMLVTGLLSFAGLTSCRED